MEVNEVRRGDFVYRDTFFADLGNGRCHPRASVAQLSEFLLLKRGQIQCSDQVGHWYEAQLLHYGLSRTKNKNAAKVRLTTAIASGNLVVPAHIVQLEADMKKEFAKINRSYRSSTSKKRKADANVGAQAAASSTKISVKVGNVTFDIDHQEKATGGSKKRKVSSPPASTTSSQRSTPAKRSTGSAYQSPAKKKQTARKSTGTPDTNRVLFSNPGQYHNTSTGATPPPSYESHDFHRSTTTNRTSASSSRLQASGIYSITTPCIDVPCELTLKKDTHTGHFWAHFLAADRRGIMHISDTTGITQRQPVTFNWRAEELECGQLLFKRDQDGWIMLDGQGGIFGCWNGLVNGEDVEFEGWLGGEPDVDVWELRERWDWFVRATMDGKLSCYR